MEEKLWEWIPLDNYIQHSVWEHKRYINKEESINYWTLSQEDELIMLITRSIFDKKIFLKEYIKEIEKLLPFVEKHCFTKKLELIYFKYTPSLLKQLNNKEYQKIIDKYIKYKDY